MSTAKIEQIAEPAVNSKSNAKSNAKCIQAAEQIAKTAGEAPAASVHAAEHITKATTEALTRSSTAAIAGIQELTTAYQTIATKRAEKLTSSILALVSVNSPVEFVELQHKLINESVSAAIADSSTIAQLTGAVFTAAFPVRVGLMGIS